MYHKLEPAGHVFLSQFGIAMEGWRKTASLAFLSVSSQLTTELKPL